MWPVCPLAWPPFYREPTSSHAALGNVPENGASLAEFLHLRDSIFIDLHDPSLQSGFGKIAFLGFCHRK